MPSTKSETQIPPPSQCGQSTWISGVDYLGASGGPSTFQLLKASDAANCCAQCYGAFPEGCQGWAYLPWNNSPVPCNIIFNFTGTDPDASCPAGHTFVSFGTDQNHAGSYGGAGPCGTVASS